VSRKACRAACKVLTQIVNGREGEDQTDDKEEDEASRRRKGSNFRGGIAVAMHRLGQLDRDKLRTVRNGGEKPGHRTPRMYLTRACI